MMTPDPFTERELDDILAHPDLVPPEEVTRLTNEVRRLMAKFHPAKYFLCTGTLPNPDEVQALIKLCREELAELKKLKKIVTTLYNAAVARSKREEDNVP